MADGKIGFIGYGSMGSMLMDGFINRNAIKQEDVFVSTRTKEKLEDIKSRFPGVNAEADNRYVAQKTDSLFICVKPADYPAILDEIRPVMHMEKHVVIITAHVGISHVERMLGCKASKIIPTVVSEVYQGITLVCHGSGVDAADRLLLESLLKSLGSVRAVDEGRLGMASELTSCAPGFFASIMKEFIESALRHAPDFMRGDVEIMVEKTMKGAAALMLEKGMNPDAVIERVATKGGITEEGVKVLEKGFPQVFDELFEKTLEKRRVTTTRLKSLLGG